MVRKIWLVSTLGLIFLGTASAEKKQHPNNDQVTYTAMPMDSGFGPLDKNPPETPVDDIVRRFTAKESEFRQALDNYVYRRSVKVQTVMDGKTDGEYQEVDDVSFDSTGKRQEKVVFAPENTLQRISMSPADFQDIQQRLPFVLTTQDIGQYDVNYVGKQKIDDLDTYVFDVGPKQIEKNKRYFQGRIWVDAQDLQIVVTNGKNVPDDTRKGHEDLSPPFITYREQIDGKYWFPVYTKGEGILHFVGGGGGLAQDVHIRELVKYTDYKQFKSSVRILYNGEEVQSAPDQQQQQPAQQPQPPQQKK
jgi:hypothetical protein